MCKCKSDKVKLIQKNSSPQIGLYCVNCGTWIKWVGKKEFMKLRLNGAELITL